MPGIVGLITEKPREWAEQELVQMVNALHHESFYVTGTWADPAVGVYVGWTAKKGSWAERMPVWDDEATIALICSGETFPTLAMGQECTSSFASQLRTSRQITHAKDNDLSFFSGLNGRFHGVLIDRTQGTVTVFNDRYGMHRLCYHRSVDAFYFAAEAKAILAVRPELRRVNGRSLGEFVACGCVLEGRTLFHGIDVLPPAAAWTFCRGLLKKKSTYFRVREWEEQTPLEPESYYEELRDVFSQNLPRYFDGPEAVAISLTGGLDTRMIMACYRPAPGSVPCYTFGGMFRSCADVQIAQRVADICQQPHEVIRVGHDFLAQFPHYAERTVYLSEGTADIGRSPDLYVSQKARDIAPVKVMGTYGSEILRQAVMFKPEVPSPGWLHPDVVACTEQASGTYAKLRREHPVSFAAFRQAPWYQSGVLALEQSQLTVRAPYLDNDFVRTVYRAPKPAMHECDIRLRLIQDGNPALRRLRSDMGYAGGSGRLSGAAAKAYSKFTHKAEYACDYGMPQWVAAIDHFFSPFRLERLFLGRHKFSHFRVWYRDFLGDYVRQILLDSKSLSRPYLQRNGLEKIVRRHINGERNYTTEIHKALTLELVHRLFVDAR
jgi:asparagine synthase (glutamine-hydrolysing)